MLKQLQTKLRIFLIVIFMAVVSLILGFSFWNTWQASQMADVSYIQRMASLIIYQLEADAGDFHNWRRTPQHRKPCFLITNGK